jgi:hypothetical protein
MSDVFDPAVYVMLPGAPGVATTRATLRPCPCGEATFEVVREPNGHVSCQCPACCERKGDVVGGDLHPHRQGAGHQPEERAMRMDALIEVMQESGDRYHAVKAERDAILAYAAFLQAELAYELHDDYSPVEALEVVRRDFRVPPEDLARSGWSHRRVECFQACRKAVREIGEAATFEVRDDDGEV